MTSGPKSILMIDDSAEDALLVSAAVGETGVPCVFKSVVSADAATAYLEGTGPYADRAANPFPSLIFLDIQMPRRDGFEVLTWIRGRQDVLRRLPVIILTSSHDYGEIKRAYDLGANSFLVKPAGFQELVKLLSDTLNYWLAHHRTPPPRPA